MELDELIGEIRREAARRRAAPDFPLDAEASIDLGLDRLGPVGSAADLPALIAALRRLPGDQPPAASGPDPDVAPAAELAPLVASAINALAARLDHLERRLGRAGPRVEPGREGDAGSAARQGPQPPAERLEAVAGHVGRGGPVLVAGPSAGRWVDPLVEVGADAYGVDPDLGAYDGTARLRSGSLMAHLGSVADRALAGAVVVGPIDSADLSRLEEWCAELARVTSRVAVWSEAPWAWRRRLGDVGADLAGRRPAGPDTWLACLDRAGFGGTGSYGPEGGDYLLLASRR